MVGGARSGVDGVGEKAVTKVEELRERLRYVTPSAWYGIIDETIAAAREEGAEQMKEAIRKESLPTVSEDGSIEYWDINGIKPGENWWLVRNSVLAPKGPK